MLSILPPQIRFLKLNSTDLMILTDAIINSSYQLDIQDCENIYKVDEQTLLESIEYLLCVELIGVTNLGGDKLEISCEGDLKKYRKSLVSKNNFSYFILNNNNLNINNTSKKSSLELYTHTHTRKTETKHKTTKQQLADYTDNIQLIDAIKRFIIHFKETRHYSFPLKDLPAFFSNLDTLGDDDEKIKLIDYAISKGWTSVWPSDKPKQDVPKRAFSNPKKGILNNL